MFFPEAVVYIIIQVTLTSSKLKIETPEKKWNMFKAVNKNTKTTSKIYVFGFMIYVIYDLWFTILKYFMLFDIVKGMTPPSDFIILQWRIQNPVKHVR